jgi:Lar family restriction alleviation protein
MNTIEKLAPCPFCGSTGAQFERIGTPRQSCIVACNNCGARHESSDEGHACGSSWNDRAQQAGGVPAGFVAVPAPGKMNVTAEGLHSLAGIAMVNGKTEEFLQVVLQWADQASAEISRLRLLAAAPTPPAVQPLSEAQIAEQVANWLADHDYLEEASIVRSRHGIVTPKEPGADKPHTS